MIINLVAGSGLAVAGWFARQLWAAVEILKLDMKHIEICLPSHYSRKDDIQCRFDRIDLTLEKLYDKLDNKADK